MRRKTFLGITSIALLISTIGAVIAYQLISNQITGSFTVSQAAPPFKITVVTPLNDTIVEENWMPFTINVVNTVDSSISGNVRLRVEINAIAGYGLNDSTVEMQVNTSPLPATSWQPLTPTSVNASDVYWEAILNGGTVPGHWNTANNVNMQIMFHNGIPVSLPFNYVISVVKD
jgi:hypothetical protein